MTWSKIVGGFDAKHVTLLRSSFMPITSDCKFTSPTSNHDLLDFCHHLCLTCFLQNYGRSYLSAANPWLQTQHLRGCSCSKQKLHCPKFALVPWLLTIDPFIPKQDLEWSSDSRWSIVINAVLHANNESFILLDTSTMLIISHSCC